MIVVADAGRRVRASMEYCEIVMVDRASDASSPGLRATSKRHPARGGRSSDPSWHRTFARALGRATRATVQELDALTRTFLRVVDSTLPDLPRSAAAVHRERHARGALLEKLGTLVMSRSEAGFSTLATDAAFWSLLRQIEPLRPRRAHRVPVPKPRRSAIAVITAHSVDPDGGGEKLEPAPTDEAE
jgi:hypothetical protein